MDFGFEDSGQDRGTGLLAVDDYTGYDGDNPMIEIGPDDNKGYEVTHQRTGLYAHTEVGSAISSDVELEEHFDQQIRRAKFEAFEWMALFVVGSGITIYLGATGAFSGFNWILGNEVGGIGRTGHIWQRIVRQPGGGFKELRIEYDLWRKMHWQLKGWKPKYHSFRTFDEAMRSLPKSVRKNPKVIKAIKDAIDFLNKYEGM